MMSAPEDGRRRLPSEAADGQSDVEPRLQHKAPWIEVCLAGLVLAGLVFSLSRLQLDARLPQPFYYKVGETWMDLHNPAYWAQRADAYDTWGAIYPPLSFVFLKLFAEPKCYALGALAARGCDHVPQFVLLAAFLINGAIVFLSYRVAQRRTAAPRAAALALGLPMLYALERGNLLILCFTCFALGYGDLLRQRWLRWLSLALAMNFKPYLGLVAMPLIVKRWWAWVAGCGFLTLAVYCVTWLLYGSGGPLQIIASESRYAIAASRDRFADVYYATSYWPLVRALESHDLGFPAGQLTAGIAVALTLAVRATQIASIACVLLALRRPGGCDLRRLSALVAGGAVTAYTSGSSGYAQMFVLFLVFFEPWKGLARPMMLVSAYLLCAPVDLMVVPVVSSHEFSYLGGREILAVSGLSVGQFVRPGLLLIIQVCLIILNMQDLLGVKARRVPATARRDSPMSTPASAL